MGFLNFLKPEKKEFLVLDFGQSSVKGLVFEKGDKKNIIKKIFREEIEKFGVFEAKDFELEVVKKAAEKVIDSLAIRNKISELPKIVSFSPEILRAKVIRISFLRKEENFEIDEKEEKTIYQSVLREGKEKLFKELGKDNNHQVGEFQILRERILERKISGYDIQSLIGFKGKKLDFKILFVFASRFKFKFAQLIIESLKLKNVKVFHQVEGLINLVKGENNESRVFLDIGGGSTQIFSFHGEIDFIDEFDIGGCHFTQAIAKGLGLQENEGEDLKKRFSKNQLTPVVRKKIEKIILPTLKLWHEALEKKLRERTEAFGVFPQNFLLFGGGARVIKGQVNYLLPDKLPLKNKTNVSFSVRDVPTLLLALT